jgi:uncharacterized protein (DUF983 family)
MIPKGTKAYSIFKGTCPKCHNDKMYVNPNPYSIAETMQMHDHCSHCGFKYKVEPNFFFGAMYVSYGVAVLAGIAIFLICYFALHTGLKTAFVAILLGLIALMPWITRFSRNIYINLFVNYRKELDRIG